MNHVFLEDRCREKVKDLLSEGMTSQECYRNKPNPPRRGNRLGGGVRSILGTIIHLLVLKKKHSEFSHKPS